MVATETQGGHPRWLDWLGAAGAILVPLGLLYSFFTADDYDDTSAALIAYAEDSSADIWLSQIVALLAPLLLGAFFASVAARLRFAAEGYRLLVVIGGTLFIAFLAVGLTLWSAPLLESELTDAGAQAYFTFDDAGWVLLGLAGISIGMAILGVSLAALQGRWLPRWAAWVSLLLGVVSLATIAAIGIFAWAIWLFAAGVFLLLGRSTEPVAPAPVRETV